MIACYYYHFLSLLGFSFGISLPTHQKNYNMSDFAKERMKQWRKLPSNTIDWETFKRLISQFGMDKGIDRAKKLISKKEEVALKKKHL